MYVLLVTCYRYIIQRKGGVCIVSDILLLVYYWGPYQFLSPTKGAQGPENVSRFHPRFSFDAFPLVIFGGTMWIVEPMGRYFGRRAWFYIWLALLTLSFNARTSLSTKSVWQSLWSLEPEYGEPLSASSSSSCNESTFYFLFLQTV